MAKCIESRELRLEILITRKNNNAGRKEIQDTDLVTIVHL